MPALRAPIRICFVCSGNICRSPTAEVLFTDLARRSGRDHVVVADSAGTGSWHVGDEMDERSRETLQRAGYIASSHAAKQFGDAELTERDLVVALDSGHLRALQSLAASSRDPDASKRKLVLLRSFDPELHADDDLDVPDPYYGGGCGFTTVLAMIERSCAVLLDAVVDALDAGSDVVIST